MQSVPRVADKHVVYEEKNGEKGHSTNMEEPGYNWTSLHLRNITDVH